MSSVCHAHEQTQVNRAHSARYPYDPFADALPSLPITVTPAEAEVQYGA